MAKKSTRDLQPRTACVGNAVVIMWNSALRETFNCYFQGAFC